MSNNFILQGNIIYSKDINNFEIIENGFLVCENGVSKGVFKSLPENYKNFPLEIFEDKIIIPGLIDLHIHAPQYNFRGTGMDLELLEWLETNTFPEEAKFVDTEYAKESYSIFVEEMKKSPNTRACIFATLHKESTEILMNLLEESGMVSYVGKVNMDRNSPEYLIENSYQESKTKTEEWIANSIGKYKNTYPIITPRFIPTCSDELLSALAEIRNTYNLTVQSHLSENPNEIRWVKELCEDSKFYGDAYDKFGLFGGKYTALMAHCVYSSDEEISLMKKNDVFAVHCPESNFNLSSGIAPIRKFLNMGVRVGLGTDIAAGHNLSIFKEMEKAIQASKLYWRIFDKSLKQLTLENAFYLGTAGGGEFFGKVGKFEDGFEFDAVVIDDSSLKSAKKFTLKERLERIIYLSDDRNIVGKFVRGKKIF